MKTCPTCGASVAVLITDAETGERFCHICAEDESTAVVVARKIHEHTVNGTLDQYPLSARLKDLRGHWLH
jgi:hypothetical protein